MSSRVGSVCPVLPYEWSRVPVYVQSPSSGGQARPRAVVAWLGNSWSGGECIVEYCIVEGSV
jgi:hypothetical protein